MSHKTHAQPVAAVAYGDKVATLYSNATLSVRVRFSDGRLSRGTLARLPSVTRGLEILRSLAPVNRSG